MSQMKMASREAAAAAAVPFGAQSAHRALVDHQYVR